MKQNIKKQIWSLNKISKSKQERANLFLKSLFGLAFLILVISVVTKVISWDAFATLTSGGVMTATILNFGNIAGNPDNEYKVGKRVKFRLWFIEQEQVDIDNFPDSTGRDLGNIPLIAGQYWHYIDTVYDSVVPKSSGKMGDVAATITNELQFILGGNGDDIFNLLEQGVGRGFYVVWQVCATGDLFIGGNACKPLILTNFDWASDKDKTGATVTFTQECGKLWQTYTGNTPTLAASVVAANATTIALTSNPQYQLTDGTAAAAALTAFTGTGDSDVGRVVTILGSGGNHPSTLSNSATEFLLVGGTQWVALAGSQITFKIFKDGAADYKFIEQSRV